MNEAWVYAGDCIMGWNLLFWGRWCWLHSSLNCIESCVNQLGIFLLSILGLLVRIIDRIKWIRTKYKMITRYWQDSDGSTVHISCCVFGEMKL